MGTLLERMQTAAKVGADKTKSETHDALVLDIVPAKSVFGKDGAEFKRVRVITKEFGSMWAFEANVVNALSSYGSGVSAKVTVVPNVYKDEAGVEQEGFNCQRVVIEALDAKAQAAIQLMPKGTALFASL